MDFGEALAIATEILDTRVRPAVDEPVAIAADLTIETDSAFVFFYNTVVFLETRSLVHALAGNGPILVERDTGAVRILESSRPWEEQV